LYFEKPKNKDPLDIPKRIASIGPHNKNAMQNPDI
jgi:hypothetical protein